MARNARGIFHVLLVATALAAALAGCSSSTTDQSRAPVCADTGTSCASGVSCCDAADTCTGNVCVAPACAGTGASCAAKTDCCNASDDCTGGPRVCTAPPTCVGTGDACGVGDTCCGDATCVSGQCTRPTADCAGTGASCASAPCCNPGDSCTGNVCEAPATCANTGEACSGTNPCCSGADTCNGTCEAPALCGGTGDSCGASKPCCSSSDSCTAGTCTAAQACGIETAFCLADADCCTGLLCPDAPGGGDRTCQVPACSHVDQPCSVPADCCAGENLACAGNMCVGEATCNDAGGFCLNSGYCCTNACANGVCTKPAGQCAALTASCTAPEDCCSGLCDTSAGTPGVCASPTVVCGAENASCDPNANDCCSGICSGASPVCLKPLFCKPQGASCTSAGECCTLDCTGNVCGGTACWQLDDPCTAATASECCTGVCTGNKCAPLPGGNGCKTLGDSCALDGDCCSANCEGGTGAPGSGTCASSFTCHAYYDVCFRGEECCSGVCDFSLSQPGSPGRCEQMPGRCTQDGNPCANDSNCCTRLCLDLGSGTKVCQPAAGCRMTGDYCDGVTSCCGGSPDAMRPDGYTISCDVGDYRCTNGTACNPPGNTCGDSSSWNCCDGKKDVCKFDSNGVKRCFGGCPNDDCSQCPTGYDANDPLCCIEAAPDPSSATTANVCQFRDQCCGGAPCVPDANGVLHCIAPTNACAQNGDECSGLGSLECCAPMTCLPVGDGFQCGADTSSCVSVGEQCSAAPEGCCTDLCVDGTCVACLPNGESCSGMSGAQCCSGICDPATQKCAAACQPAGGTCTGNLDCCAGIVCNIPLGATSGTCGSQQMCSQPGQPCSDVIPCCADAYCDPEAGSCQGL